MSILQAQERKQSINGIEGRYHGATVGGNNYKEGTFTSQRWGTSKIVIEDDEERTVRVELRFDDECRNGHNTFTISGREFVEEYFPALLPLMKWHLTSSDGPMHYAQNVVYLAGNRDCWGKKKGEPKGFDTFARFGTSPILHKLSKKFAAWLQDPDVRLDDLEVIRVDHDKRGVEGEYQFDPQFTFGGFDATWGGCPFDSEAKALQWAEGLAGPHTFTAKAISWGEGKERDLEAARRVAIWPEATDEELSVEPDELREALAARLPGLLADFRADMESCGFLWAPDE